MNTNCPYTACSKREKFDGGFCQCEIDASRSPGCYIPSELDSKRLDWPLKNVIFSELIEILDIEYGATLQDRKAAIDRKMGI